MDEVTTPVGTSFMSRFTDFEVSEGGAAGDGGGGDPGAGGNGGGGGGGSFPAPAIPAANDELLSGDGLDALGDPEFDGEGGELEGEPAEWSGPTQDEWQGVMQSLQAVGQLFDYLQAEEPPAAQPAAPPEPSILDRAAAGEVDLSDPATFQQAARAEAERMIEERFGPYEGILNEQAQAQGEKMVNDALDQIAGDIGEFDRNHALITTQALLANNVPPEQAFRQAAAVTQQFEARIREEAVAAYREQMGHLDEVPAEPAAGGAARETEKFEYDPRDPDKYAQLAARFLERKEAAKRQAAQPTIG